MKRDRKFFRMLWGLTVLAAPATLARGQTGREPFPSSKAPSGQPAAEAGRHKERGGLSDSDCRAFAESVIEAVEAGDRARFNALVDWDALINTSATGWNIPDWRRQALFAGVRKGIEGEHGLASELIANSNRGGTLSFLRARPSRGRQVALLRMIGSSDEAGVNYYEFALRRSSDGQIRATDIYVYIAGEFFSESLRRLLLPLTTDQAGTAIDGLSPRERSYLRDLDRLRQARDLANQGKPKEALAIYDQLAPETRGEKALALGRMRLARQAKDDGEYAAILEDVRRSFPNDPAVELLLIDALVMRRDYAGAMKAVDQLDRSVEGDPYLDVIRAGIQEDRGDREAARRSALRSIEREPTLLLGYWALVNLSMKAGDYGETLARLKEIDQKFDFEFEDLGQVPEFAGFAKSPQYAGWLDYLKKRAPNQDPAPTGKDPR